MILNFEEKEGKLYCVFSGRLDTEACIEYQDQIDEKIKEASVKVLFNFKEVDYISSSFLRICLKSSKELGQDRFAIINVSPNIKKVFKIAGFDRIINIK
ncbi:STAS domain-containing protein [Candidatus Margulisiibacteriota bacterium]